MQSIHDAGDKDKQTINTVWLGGPLNPLSVACINNWRSHGFDYRVWTESDPLVSGWINECEFTKECYKRKLYAFVSDYIRLKILQKNGGLYLDTDVTIKENPFPIFENKKFCVGLEKHDTVGSAVIYSEKNSLILNKAIEFYEKEIIKSSLYIGPSIINELIKRHGTDDNHTIYDIEFFYSYTGNGKLPKETPNTYLIHWFQHSWKKNSPFYLKSKHQNLWGKIYTWQKYFFRLNRK